MTRFFVFLLLFAVVFLSGMVMGIDRENAQMEIEKIINLFESKETPQVEEEMILEEEIVSTEQSIDMDGPVHLTQKTASFLEAGVKGFYEIIVEVLYQISTIFF